MKSQFPALAAILMVLSIIIVRRYYIALAKKHDKLPIGYVSLGLGVYFAGFVVVAVVLTILKPYIAKGYDSLHIAAMWGFACFCSWMVYYNLRNSLEKGSRKDDELLDK